MTGSQGAMTSFHNLVCSQARSIQTSLEDLRLVPLLEITSEDPSGGPYSRGRSLTYVNDGFTRMARVPCFGSITT